MPKSTEKVASRNAVYLRLVSPRERQLLLRRSARAQLKLKRAVNLQEYIRLRVFTEELAGDAK